jgi:deoxyribodipyrimidine photo-lyase
MFDLSIFIFRRDLRLTDNTGLLKAASKSNKILPIFIFTPIQISDENSLKSSNSIQFMIESLFDLNESIQQINSRSQLFTFYGDEIEVLTKLCSRMNISAIFINEDYTPYSIKRDSRISQFCNENSIYFRKYTDILLIGTHDIAAKNGNRYYNFTFFYKNATKIKVNKPKFNKISFMESNEKLARYSIDNQNEMLLRRNFYQMNSQLAERGGRKKAMEILENIRKFKNYSQKRDCLTYQTTMLSAHNKYGTVSIREVYYYFIQSSPELVKQLYWRDFYYYVSIYFDSFYKYEHIYRNLKIKWNNNSKYYTAWIKGKTGFPIVDAAMNQLNTTGYMHNRARLIASSFFVKDLLLNWKYGEQYFSKKLVDIDRAQNLGNWNWSASFGLDNSSFLRILNPWTQSKKFDPECKYIKTWLPVLSDIPPNHLHNWNIHHKKYSNINYPSPIVDHSEQREKFKKMYKFN